ncbi:unnamed protein product [Ixodes pacificus]
MNDVVLYRRNSASAKQLLKSTHTKERQTYAALAHSLVYLLFRLLLVLCTRAMENNWVFFFNRMLNGKPKTETKINVKINKISTQLRAAGRASCAKMAERPERVDDDDVVAPRK